MGRTHGPWQTEWLYGKISKGLLAGPFLGTASILPIDYNFHVFGDQVEFFQIQIARKYAHRCIVLGRNWQSVSTPSSDADPAQPKSLGAMIEAAEHFGQEFNFVRADFYKIDKAPMLAN